MKVAVSIPDAVFADAERLAKQLNASRSELYARALGAFVDRYATDDAASDAFMRSAARRVFDQVEW